MRKRTTEVKVYIDDKQWIKEMARKLELTQHELVNKIIRSPTLELNKRIMDEIKKKKTMEKWY